MTISTSNQSVVPKDMPQRLGLETLRLKASHKLKLLILGAVGALVPVVSTKEPRRIASSLG